MRVRLMLLPGFFACVAASVSGEARAEEPACEQVQGIDSSWTWCENSITRMSPEERANLVSKEPITFGGKPETGPTTWKWRGDAAGDPKQASFSWNNLKGLDWMTPVRSQGSCGSCFVFGSVAAMESEFKYMTRDPMLDVNLSEQAVISCISWGSCKSGGTAEEVGMRLKSQGVPDESCYPYTASEGSCESVCADWEQRRAFITDWHMSVWPWSDADMKTELVFHPLIVNMQIYSDFNGYKSGVYSRSPTAKAEGWHVVTLVGWDNTDNSWIVRNSWGDDWGMKGYFKMSRASDCSILLNGVCFASHLNYFDIMANDMPGLGCMTQHEVKLSAVRGQKAKTSLGFENCGALSPFTIKFSFTPKVPWMTLTATQPKLAPGESTQVNLTADSATLPAGVHKTVLKLFGGAGIQTVNVQFTVTEPPSPEPQPEAGTGPGVDASAQDAAAAKDAAPDGWKPSVDGASAPDGETDPTGQASWAVAEDDGGCGCRSAGSSGARWWGALALGLLLVRRRSRSAVGRS
jgi:MYXO-CTERM domain-containing protein